MNDLVPIGCWHRWHRKQVSCQLFPLYSILRAPGSGDRGNLCNIVCSKMTSVSQRQRTHFQFIFFLCLSVICYAKTIKDFKPLKAHYRIFLLVFSLSPHLKSPQYISSPDLVPLCPTVVGSMSDFPAAFLCMDSWFLSQLTFGLFFLSLFLWTRQPSPVMFSGSAYDCFVPSCHFAP